MKIIQKFMLNIKTHNNKKKTFIEMILTIIVVDINLTNN